MATPTMPVLDGRPFEELCDAGYRPLRLTDIMQIWLQQHFSKASNIVQVGIKDRIWTDSDDSKIQIYPVSDWRPRETEKRPALIIKRNELKFVRYGIDNRYMGSGFVASGQKNTYAAGLQGSHTVFCMAGEGGEAEQLGAEVAQELMKFAPVVRVWLNMLRVELVGMGELSILEEATENFAVPVSIAYAFMEQWALTPLDEATLTRIKLQVNKPAAPLV